MSDNIQLCLRVTCRLFALLALVALCESVRAQGVQTITLDGAAAGREFEGLGAVSGGNTSRLLIDYPPTERKQILDYLFKPNFGASLNELKVEVGGDVNSTEGSEPSFEHVKGEENYNRGFEWWLMEQAKARNQSMIFDCLAWGAPGWIGNGNFWSADMMNYYINFIKGAKQFHDIDITSVGGRNERGYYASWYEGFRKSLDAAGLSSVGLVGSDDWGPSWLNLANQAVTDPVLNASVSAFAGHVTWSENPAVASNAVLALNKPLWNSELHDYVDDPFNREISLVNDFNTNYIKTKIAKNTMWNLIWSYYPISSYPDVGIIRANSPWSGHYELLPIMWGFAHIDQFVHPGWKFVDNGGCGNLTDGGTYTTLMAPNGRDYSIIAETRDATTVQRITFKTTGGFSREKTLYVWRSMQNDEFDRDQVISTNGHDFSIDLQPDTIYSITTTLGQCKGEYPDPPENAPLTLPYADDYQNYAIGAEAKYHFDYEGSFEIAQKTIGIGKCLRQAAAKSDNGWGGAYLPLTFLGDSSWTDYKESVDTYIETAGAVSLHGRINSIPADNNDDPPGYTLRIQDNGNWTLKSFKTTISSGICPFSANAWHTIALNFHGTSIVGAVDGKTIVTANDSTYGSGLVGLGSGWNFAQFCNLKIVPN